MIVPHDPLACLLLKAGQINLDWMRPELFCEGRGRSPLTGHFIGDQLNELA